MAYKASLEKAVLVSLETVVLGAVSALQSKPTRNTLIVTQVGFITYSKEECKSRGTLRGFLRRC